MAVLPVGLDRRQRNESIRGLRKPVYAEFPRPCERCRSRFQKLDRCDAQSHKWFVCICRLLHRETHFWILQASCALEGFAGAANAVLSEDVSAVRTYGPAVDVPNWLVLPLASRSAHRPLRILDASTKAALLAVRDLETSTTWLSSAKEPFTAMSLIRSVDLMTAPESIGHRRHCRDPALRSCRRS